MLSLPESAINGTLMLCDGGVYVRPATDGERSAFLALSNHPRASAFVARGWTVERAAVFARQEATVNGQHFSSDNGPGIWFGGAGF